eukprot:scaffold9793_cov144-Skeletonema_menzelii.AAC.13
MGRGVVGCIVGNRLEVLDKGDEESFKKKGERVTPTTSQLCSISDVVKMNYILINFPRDERCLYQCKSDFGFG